MIPGSASPFFLGSSLAVGAGGGGYQVSRSLRFNSSDSAYLSRTPAVAGDRRTWTWAGWVKRSKLGATSYTLFGIGGNFLVRFTDDDSGDGLRLYNGSPACSLITTSKFRDPSAWYHIVIACDTTQATASNRIKFYVNNVQQTTFYQANYPALNDQLLWNSVAGHAIGNQDVIGSLAFFDGYLADIHFIDGQALTPSSFTEVSATTGQLIPKAYAGTYTGNSFWLKFNDNSAATATTLGKDSFLLGNNWTPFNVSTGGPTSVAAATGALPVFNTTDTYGAVKGTGTRTDTNSASIVLALPMDGTNGGTSFGDQSAVIKGSGSAKTVTITGNTNTSTAVSKFYGSSGYFDGSGDRLLLNGGSDFIFGTSSFTVEAWVYKIDSSESIFFSQFYTANTSSRDGVALGYYGGKLWILQGDGTNWLVETQQGIFPQNSWVHIAASRDYANTKTYYFINGELVYTYTTNVNLTAGNNGDVTIGDAGSTANYSWDGYINDLRIYKGVAKYTSNFNPPSATANAAGNDSLVDTPTSGSEVDTGLGGQVTGNYCTLNPLDINTGTLSNGNLDISGNSGIRSSTFYFSSGKWYFEYTVSNISGGWIAVGAQKHDSDLGNFAAYRDNGQYYNGSGWVSYGASYNNGDVIGVAFDRTGNTIEFFKNGTSQGSLSRTFTIPVTPVINQDGSANFGQRAFAYTAPSGFKALCDTNLGAPLVAKPNTVMDVKLYTGNGSTQTISGLGFSPDFAWFKSRSAAENHVLSDSVRGADRQLFSNLTNAEQTNSTYVTSFTGDGFSLGSNTGTGGNNINGSTYVAWAWDAGTSTVSNTSGSITSQVRANASAGFSVVTYTGAANTPSSIGHGLNVVPQFVIVKPRTTSDSWVCYHSAFNDLSKYIVLNSTNAVGTAAANYWGTSADWTSSTFGVYPLGGANNNLVGVPTVAYCFAPVVGYSNGFSYTGNGSTDGVFQYLGFRPRLILLKCSSTTGNWTLLDTAREGYNVDNDPLYPNLSNAEGTTDLLDITSNGFKLRTTDASVNSSGATYIGFAWAENPFQYARAR